MDASAAATPPTKKSTPSEAGVHPASALTIGVKLKEFVVTGIIGEGGFGIVYSAKDTQLQRNVAIKEYMPAAIANRLASSKINLRSVRHQQTFAAGMQGFIDEARLLAQFKHPALVEILRFWEANGTAYMVMPHYSGKTLRNILKTSRNVCSERWLKSILGPVLDAIELLHSNHVYHRDIAPDNIVIQDSGQPVLLDLGSARRVIAGMQSALTVVVKPGYAPIEQYTEDTANEQGPWTDIYALGAVLYFAISGAAPIASVSRMMRDSLMPLNTKDCPHYSSSFLSSINKALQLRPCDRFQSIAEFRDALNIHTSLTGNIALAAAPEGVTHQETHINDQRQDEEITIILSEEEISVFKEKLIQSFLLPEATISDRKKINENIISNDSKTKNEPSLSSFADVKDLLENKKFNLKNKNSSTKTTIRSNTNTEDNSQQKNTDKNQKASADVKYTAIKLPIAIGISVLISIILVVNIFISSNNEGNINQSLGSQKTPFEATDSSNKTIESYTGNGLLENGRMPLLTQGNTSQNSKNKTQFGTEILIFEGKPINILEQPEGQTTGHQANSDSNQKPEGATDTETTQANQSINYPPKDLITDNAQTEKDNKKIVKQIVAVDITETNSAPKAIEMGSAKITLIPWGEIWVNNQRFGVSPPLREILLAPGIHTIELRNPGLPTETRTLIFSKGENIEIYHNFSEANRAADLADYKSNKKDRKKETKTEKNQQEIHNINAKESVKSNADLVPQKNPDITSERLLRFKVMPWGEIFLNGKMVGVTPPLYELKLAPGEHTIEIRHPNYTTKNIRITADDPVTEKIEHSFQ